MVHRLITLVSKAGRIFENGLFTVNLNIVTQIKPRYSHYRQLFSKSRVYKSSHESGKKFDKSIRRTRSNKPELPNQDHKFGGNGRGGRSRRQNSSGPFSDEELKNLKIWLFSTIVGGLVVFFYLTYLSWLSRKPSYYEITWKDFVDNYLNRDRVAKPKVIDETWLQFQAAPNTSAGITKTLRVRLTSVDSNELIALLAKLLKIAAGNEGRTRK